ncbi:Eco57I restriction-modification methylase domain-containing protein [Methanobrevibacter sp.]|uniref:Eco57I restriction-modification methylase domain-containing protein n=1 Tax=Methanobrevibacter sp. TaxID=66852 RepID=UPI00388DEBBE
MVNAVLSQEKIDAGREIIADLVAKFNNNKGFYTSNLFKEEEAKVEFINPMFEALGWDIHNKQGLGPNFKEVVFEESLAIGKETKAPDYSFRLGGQLIYYLEAKKPSVNIKDDRSPAFQARRYGWSAKIPIVILTDFEEFAIYETTSKPKEHERASTNRVMYYTCDDYLDNWEEIYSLFSKEAVQKELFQKFVDDETSKTKKGTQSIDVEFLKDIEKWRLLLARNIALRNKELSLSELNLAVQLIIDRIVFFRMAEDRGIERYQTLYKLAESENIYEQLCEVFKRADLKYNSGLFHFTYTPDYSEFVDNITLHLNIDDGVFKKIFADLYYPKSPYEFSVISPEILGNIYENFLGSIIRLTPSHQAKIEQKPEVKKAGGVFYTPQYIVDYIVENTVGKLIKDKTPNQISKLRILDPACGSGSFLLRAYQKLIDYHLEYYIGLKKPPKEVYYVGKDNVPRLTIREKKRILTNNIYGVDIDVNAVEVTKLSLLLKVLEDENKDVLEQQQKLYQEKVLPNLSFNIKCGNSLIEPDISMSFDELRELNPFNWKVEFQSIFDNGGFDAVIGNPPYVNAKTLTETNPTQKEYIISSGAYETLYQKWDLYIPFIEKSLQILKNNGLFSMIIPYPFIDQQYGKLLRKKIIEEYNLVKLVDLSSQKVFKNATVSNCIPIISKGNPTKKVMIADINQKLKINDLDDKSVEELVANDKSYLFDLSFSRKLSEDFSSFKSLGEYCFISVGMVLNADEKKAKGQFKKADLIQDTPSDIHIKQYIEGKNIDRYKINKIRYLEWGSRRVPSKIRRPTFEELYLSNKLLVNKLGKIKAVYDDTQIFCDQTLRVLVLWKDLEDVENRSVNNSVKRYGKDSRVVLEENSLSIDLKFILGILNSKMGQYLLNQIRGEKNKDINPDYLKDIKIPPVLLPQQEKLIGLVDSLLYFNKQLNNVSVPNEVKLLENQIALVDNEIDEMVYELYGLTDDEIAIIEDSLV